MCSGALYRRIANSMTTASVSPTPRQKAVHVVAGDVFHYQRAIGVGRPISQGHLHAHHAVARLAPAHPHGTRTIRDYRSPHDGGFRIRCIEPRRLAFCPCQPIEILDAHARLHHGGEVVFQKLHRLRHALQREYTSYLSGACPVPRPVPPPQGKYGKIRLVRARENTAEGFIGGGTCHHRGRLVPQPERLRPLVRQQDGIA